MQVGRERPRGARAERDEPLLVPLADAAGRARASGRGRGAGGRRPPRRGSRSRRGSPAPRGRDGRGGSRRRAAASSRSTAAGPSTVGRRSQTAGATSSLATFSVSLPSKIRKRKNVERLARCRPMLVGARPEAPRGGRRSRRACAMSTFASGPGACSFRQRMNRGDVGPIGRQRVRRDAALGHQVVEERPERVAIGVGRGSKACRLGIGPSGSTSPMRGGKEDEPREGTSRRDSIRWIYGIVSRPRPRAVECSAPRLPESLTGTGRITGPLRLAGPIGSSRVIRPLGRVRSTTTGLVSGVSSEPRCPRLSATWTRTKNRAGRRRGRSRRTCRCSRPAGRSAPARYSTPSGRTRDVTGFGAEMEVARVPDDRDPCRRRPR